MCLEKVSIIMSSYNEKREFIIQAIESILNQTYKNIEYIIVIDNPSNKSIIDVIDRYSMIDKRITVIGNKCNIGLTASLNKALEICNGKYIARMDADDISDPNRIERELQYLKKNKLDLVGCMTRRIDEKGNIVNELTNISYTPAHISKKLMFDNCIAHPTWLVKKEVYDTLHNYREISTAEDYDFLLRSKKNGFSLGICDECLFSYRVNTSGISRNNSLRQTLTSHILQKEYNNIEAINQVYIDSLINPHLSESSKVRFEQGIRLIDKAIYQIRKKNPLALVSLCQALLCSKYIWLKLYKIYKIHSISI